MDSRKQRGVIRGTAIGALAITWGVALAIVLNLWLGLIVVLLGLAAFERVARGRVDPEKLAVKVIPASSPQQGSRPWRPAASPRVGGGGRAHPTTS
jgi:hypothetical protein